MKTELKYCNRQSCLITYEQPNYTREDTIERQFFISLINYRIATTGIKRVYKN